MNPFEFLDHAADLKFRAYGKTLDECFANAAVAIFSSMTALEKINPEEERRINLEASDKETLLHDWLSELIFIFSTEQILFESFFVSITGNGLSAVARGEKFDPKKHTLEKEVKAVTYHDMTIVEKDGLWTIQVVCDT